MKYLILIIFTLFNIKLAYCQPNSPSIVRQNIEASKIEHIKQALDLTPAVSQLFWPVYDAYSKELKEIKQLRKQALETQNNNTNPSTQDANTYIDTQLNLEQKETDLNKKYRILFTKVLSPQQILKLYKAQREFKINLLNKFNKNNPSVLTK